MKRIWSFFAAFLGSNRRLEKVRGWVRDDLAGNERFREEKRDLFGLKARYRLQAERAYRRRVFQRVMEVSA